MFPLTCIVANSGLRRCLLTSCSTQVRHVNLDTLSNKKITRLESDIELEDSEYKSRLINRNPRNLEQLSFEIKPKGFWLDKSPPSTWNKLVLEQSGRHLNAYLLHWSGKKLVEASTRESQLSKYFRSPSSTQAATILAKVIARRCLQSGYLNAGVDERDENQDTGLKTKVFFESVESSGLVLKELEEISPRTVSDL